MDSIPDVWIKTNVGPSFMKWSFHKGRGIRSSCEPDTVVFVVKPPFIVSDENNGSLICSYNTVVCKLNIKNTKSDKKKTVQFQCLQFISSIQLSNILRHATQRTKSNDAQPSYIK